MKQALFTINIKNGHGDIFGSEILTEQQINKIKSDIEDFFEIHEKFEYYEICRSGSNLDEACDVPYAEHISFSVTKEELLNSITITELSKEEVDFLNSLNLGCACNCSVFEDMTTMFEV